MVRTSLAAAVALLLLSCNASPEVPLTPDKNVAERVRVLLDRAGTAASSHSAPPIGVPQGPPWNGPLELDGSCVLRARIEYSGGRIESTDASCTCRSVGARLKVICDPAIFEGEVQNGRATLVRRGGAAVFYLEGKATGASRLAGTIRGGVTDRSELTVRRGEWELVRTGPGDGPAALSAPNVIDGATFPLDGLCANGQILVLNFWTTWCAPCLREMPLLEAFHRRHGDDGIHLVTVEVGSDPDLVRHRVEHLGVSFPVLLDQDGRLASRWGVAGYPTTLILADGCRVVERTIGFGGNVERRVARLRAGR